MKLDLVCSSIRSRLPNRCRNSLSYAIQARYGARAGQPNPRFLDAKLFNEIQ